MAKTKPGRLYKQIKSMSYTRREYMGGVPGARITQFDLGDKVTDYPVTVSLVAEERCAIIHNALESARISAVRALTKGCGATGFHLKIRTYPHEVFRENKQASGAGADRVSQGMRRSFGKAIAVGARVAKGQAIMTVRVRAEHFPFVKEAFRKANMKLPIPTRLVFEKGEKEVMELVSKGLKAVAVGGKAPAPAKEEGAPAEGEAAAPAAAEAKPAAGAKGGDAKGAAKGGEKKDEKKPAKK